MSTKGTCQSPVTSASTSRSQTREPRAAGSVSAPARRRAGVSTPPRARAPGRRAIDRFCWQDALWRSRSGLPFARRLLVIHGSLPLGYRFRRAHSFRWARSHTQWCQFVTPCKNSSLMAVRSTPNSAPPACGTCHAHDLVDLAPVVQDVFHLARALTSSPLERDARQGAPPQEISAKRLPVAVVEEIGDVDADLPDGGTPPAQGGAEVRAGSTGTPGGFSISPTTRKSHSASGTRW